MDHEFGRLPPSISCPAGPVTAIAYGGMPVLPPYTTMAESYNAIAAMRNHTLTYAPGFCYYEPPVETGLMPAGHYSGSSQYGGSQSQDSQYGSSHQSHASIHYRSTAGTPSHVPLMGVGLKLSDSDQRLGYTADEPCKVVITSIQHKARQSDVANWIRHQIGEYSSAITGMDIPLVEPKGRIRGHAFLTLMNPTAAEATVRILDQKLFQGRVVSARLTTDITTDAERIKLSKDSRPRHHRHEQFKEASRPTRQVDQIKMPRDDPKPSKASSRASTSSPSPSTQQKQPSKPPEETVKPAGPVIAHGSSTRKPDKK